MASMGYISIPTTASRLQSKSSSIHPAKRIFTSLPPPSPSPAPSISSSTSFSFPGQTSPIDTTFSILPQLLLSSTLPLSDPKPKQRHGTNKNPSLLITTGDPLSLPTTTANFKRFVVRVGPIFWFQDRIEEILMWRRGWKVTSVWLMAYGFLCYFPRMVFLLPHAILIGIMLSSYPYPDLKPTTPSPAPPAEGRVDWQANIQAIQNLMGFVADTYDLIQPYAQHLVLSPSHLTSVSSFTLPPSISTQPMPNLNLPHLSPYPPYILLILLLSFPPLALIFSSPWFPARLACFLVGVLPIICTHPRVWPILLKFSNPRLFIGLSQYLLDNVLNNWKVLLGRLLSLRSSIVLRLPSKLRGLLDDDLGRDQDQEQFERTPILTLLERIIDDDKLDDRCWRAEIREVELWENQRYVGTGYPFSRSSTESIPAPTTKRPPAYPDGLTDINNLDSALDKARSQTSSPPSIYSTPGSSTPLFPLPLEAAITPSARALSRLSMSLTSSPSPSLPFPNRIQTPSGGVLGPGPGTWSKAHLKPSERRGWTRGRDGWGGVRATPPRARTKVRGKERAEEGDGDVEGHGLDNREQEVGEEGDDAEGGDNEGYVSSNLTFSLAPGWAFVKTEGWRKDRIGKWAGDEVESMDGSGWVYTNDAWDAPRGAPDAGSVTRRRRWVRRIWFDGPGAVAGSGAGVGK